MIIELSALTFGAALAIAVVGLAVTALIDAWQGSTGLRSLTVSLAASAIGWAAWAGWLALARPELDPLLTLPVTALGGLAAVLASIPVRLLGHGPAVSLAFAALWSALVFGPVAIALFSLEGGVLGAFLVTVDLAGALPTLVAAGGGGAAVLLAGRRHADPPRDAARPWLLLGLFAIVWALWTVWLVGMELAVDELTWRIIINTLLAPPASAAAWLVVQRAQHAKTTPTAAVGGLLCGLVSIAPGCGNLGVVGALLTGLVAGSTCSLVGYRLAARTGNPGWLIVTILVGGGGLGTGLIGAFASRTGLIFTGQPEQLLTQFASAALVTVFAVTVSFIAWAAVAAVVRPVRGDVASRAAS